MRQFAVLVCALVLTGCGVEVLTTTAIQGELQAQQMTAMKRQLNDAGEMAARTNIERAIQTYQAEKGTNPPSLEALVPNYLPALPEQPFNYDPASGRLVEAVNPAAGPTPQDYDTMAKIRAAIQQYGTAVGYYPNTLDDLAPTYMATAPRTSAGEPFIYNNQNGEVTHPRSAGQAAPVTAQAASGGRAVGGGGTGPMGEVMTGVGIQQQLNSNSSAGVSSAGSYSRQAVRGTSNEYSDNQNKAMDNLGL